jgi:hypothetical protein
MIADKDRSLNAEVIGGCDPSSGQDTAPAMADMGVQADSGDRSRSRRSGLKVELFVHCFFPNHFFGTETYTLR